MKYAEKQTCDGCGAQAHTMVGVVVCPGVNRKVCANATVSRETPKKSCEEKARDKASGCPGCGTRLRPEQYKARELCANCFMHIKRGAAVPPSPLVLGIIDPTHLLGDYLGKGMGDAGELDKLPGLLAAALGDRVVSSNAWEPGATTVDLNETEVRGHSKLKVELPAARVPAVQAFLAALKKVGAALQARGRAEGHSVLYRLAAGEMTIDDYTDNLLRRR